MKVTYYLCQRNKINLKKFKSIAAIFLSVLVLSTSVGAIMYQHYCGSSLKEVSLAKIDKHCTAHQADGMCHHDAEEKGCCKTEKKALNTAEKSKPANDDFSVIKKGSQFVTVFYVLVQYLFTNPFEAPANTLVIASPDPPPCKTASIVIDHQSFLI